LIFAENSSRAGFFREASALFVRIIQTREAQNPFRTSVFKSKGVSEMKKIVLGSFLALGASSLLAGCGLLPPIELPANLLQLQGKTLSVPLSLASAPVSTRTAGVGKASLTASFEDIVLPSIPFDPSSLEITLELAKAAVTSTATPSSACLTTATDVLVTVSNFKVELFDGIGPSHTYTKTLPSASFHVNPSNGNISGLDISGLTVVIPEVVLIKSILTLAPTPNTVSVSTDVTTNPPLAGCTITITFGAGKAFAKL
jgi:hypothetical protein